LNKEAAALATELGSVRQALSAAKSAIALEERLAKLD
jgi:hypothetical protein